MSGTSGPTSPTRLARYDPEGCCWRTCEATLVEDSTPFSPTLPPWGMTRDGVLYGLPTPARLTDASGSSSLVPTPRATEHRTQGEVLLPTPTVGDSRGSRNATAGRTDPDSKHHSGQTLADVFYLLPTPAAHDSGNTPENHLRKKPGRTQVTSLQVIVDYGLLSTGGRICPPSDAGSTPADALPLDPPSHGDGEEQSA